MRRYKISQLSPLTSSEATRMRIAIPGHSSDPLDLANSTFLRSWAVYDSRLEDDEPGVRLNSNVAWGMLVMIGVSAAFWTGLGLLVARVWK